MGWMERDAKWKKKKTLKWKKQKVELTLQELNQFNSKSLSYTT